MRPSASSFGSSPTIEPFCTLTSDPGSRSRSWFVIFTHSSRAAFCSMAFVYRHPKVQEIYPQRTREHRAPMKKLRVDSVLSDKSVESLPRNDWNWIVSLNWKRQEASRYLFTSPPMEPCSSTGTRPMTRRTHKIGPRGRRVLSCCRYGNDPPCEVGYRRVD